MFFAVAFAATIMQQQSVQAPPPPEQQHGYSVSAAAIAADTGALRHSNGRVPPVINAVRAHSDPPHIDGRIDDPVWALAGPAGQFTQLLPIDGDAATERTEVRLAYDGEALYVAARMYDSEPDLILAYLGRRDGETRDDKFEFSIDSYHDHRTAFVFRTNPRGVKGDAVYSNDEGSGDDSWDPVWDVAARRDSLGWTAEFRIPLSQLRFSNAPNQVWGINFRRRIQRKGETDLWAYSSQTETGHASYFGHVLELRNLPQPQRLEVLPYVTGVEERLSSGSAGNPFNDGSNQVGRVGLDVKYGLTSNMTVNATVNPDFGQVEADPAVVNLTDYETYFGEKRPFFVEGADIFRGGNQQYFYSRRIGRAPQRYVSAPELGYADLPNNATIIGAAKLTGRTAGGWSFGMLEAVTAREYAKLMDSAGVRTSKIVEPFTNNAVFRAKRDFHDGASTIGFIGTALNRQLNDSRLDFLRSSAYAGGVDLSHRFSGNRFRFTASLGYSYVGGDTSAIRRAQTSSARYFQRPDAEHVTLDPTRNNLTGWTGAIGFARIQGNYTYNIAANATSPGFEINDLGYQTRADRIGVSGNATRRWTRPGRVFRSADVAVSARASWNHGGDRLGTSAQLSGSVEFLNYWFVMGYVEGITRAVSDNLTRGGPVAVVPAGWNVGFRLASDNRKRMTLWGGGNARGDELGSWNAWIFANINWQPNPKIAIQLVPEYGAGVTAQQYLTSGTDETASSMFGTRYVFAEVYQQSTGLWTRFNLTLSPTLSLQLYAQPYIATGDYRGFKELQTPRTTDYLVYGETPGSNLNAQSNSDGTIVSYELEPDGAGPREAFQIDNPDFSYTSLRGNAVLRWEYSPGSTLFFVWTRSCSAYGSNPQFDPADAVQHLCQGQSDNVFAVKLNYWLSF